MQVKPYLKWVGGKTRVLPVLKNEIRERGVLVEPFTGAGSVFMGLEFEYYLCGDFNGDLINCHLRVQQDVNEFIKGVKHYFSKKYLNEKAYIKNREIFNTTNDLVQKACLFTYLNKHGYNGLCRYNKKGGYNVSWGKKLHTVDPEIEMIKAFHVKAQRAKFIHQHYTKTFAQAPRNAVIYCDPPYLPTDDKPSFTQYTKTGFPLVEQQTVAILAEQYKSTNAVLISNHNTEISRKLYHGATKTVNLEVTRSVACSNVSRGKAKEILAIYGDPLDEEVNCFNHGVTTNRM